MLARWIVLAASLGCSSSSRGTGPDIGLAASPDRRNESPSADAAPAVDASYPATSGNGGMERFVREPRSDAFAGPREALYNQVFEVIRKLNPGIDLTAACKTTACSIVARIPADLSFNDVAGELQRIPWGDRVSLIRDDRTLRLYPVLDGPMASIKVHADWMRRKGMLP
jgi:hypothetical protein